MNGRKWIPIQYREFYDIPRVFVLTHRGDTFLFDCPFDDEADDYRGHYVIKRLDPSTAATLAHSSWVDLGKLESPAGRVPTELVRFDPTRRKAVDASILQYLSP